MEETQNLKELLITDILSEKESKYSLVIAIAKRAREITDEINSVGDIITETPINIAIHEFKEGKYRIFAPKAVSN
jgi:DNA-directed RNA polymerase subunit omega